MLMNGKIIGDLRFTVNEFFTRSSEKFILIGKINENNLSVIASGCHFTYIQESSSKNVINCTIKVRNFFVSAEGNLVKPKGKLYFGVDVVNVPETLGVIVNSPMGNLQIAHFKDIFTKFNNVIRNFDSPIITSIFELEFFPDGRTKVKDIHDKFKIIVKNFLKITSFAYLNNHQAVCYHVYGKNDKGQSALLLSELRSSFVTTTSTPHLTCDAHSSNFINEAWNGFTKKGFSEELEKNHGFNSALYWLVESTMSSYFEPKFIDACTCLETLMDRFHSKNQTDLILDENSFKDLRKVLEKKASEWLVDKNIKPVDRNSVYENLGSIGRRSFIDKASSLIDSLKVDIGDITTTIDDVVKIRNKITHTGVSSVFDTDYVWKTYKDLMSILVRIFLAMIDDHGLYKDPWQGEWINFDEKRLNGQQ
jgi:hypothetical protein